MLALVNDIGADRILDLEYEPGLQGLQHPGCTGFFPFLDTRDEVLVTHADVVDGPPRADAGRQAAIVNALVKHEHTARTRTTKELVRRNKYRVDARVVALELRIGVHIDIDVRRTGREIKTGHGVMAVQQASDPAHI